MNKIMASILLMVVFCLSGCISINNSVTTPALVTPTMTPVTTAIRTSAEQTPVVTPVTPVVTSVPFPCSNCGYQYKHSTYQYPTTCTTCPQTTSTPTVIYQPSTPTVIYQPSTPTVIYQPNPVITATPVTPTIVTTPVTPTIVTTPVTPVTTSSNVTDLGYYGSNSWRSQTFTGVSSISQITVSMEKVGNPGDVICEVGGASYRASASSIRGKSNYVFPISTTFATSMIFHVTSGDHNNFYRIYGTNFNSYDGGTLNTSENGGRTWRSYPKLDMFFVIN